MLGLSLPLGTAFGLFMALNFVLLVVLGGHQILKHALIDVVVEEKLVGLSGIVFIVDRVDGRI